MGRGSEDARRSLWVQPTGWLVLFLQVLPLVVALSPVWAQEPGWRLIPHQTPAPALALPDAGDVLVDLQGYRGKVVLVSFWTSDCPPCQEHLDALRRLRERFRPGELVILAVHVGEPPEGVFPPAPPGDFPILFVPAAKDLETWDFQDLPASFLVDRLGRLAYASTLSSEIDRPGSLNIIKELLKSRAGQRRIEQLGDDCLPLERY